MFEHLFKPGRIGSIEVQNRLIMAPLVTHFASANGEVTEQLIDYYVQRTRGGVGLQIVEGTYIGPERGVARLSIGDDQMIPGLNRLVESIHDWGGLVFCQFNHQGMLLWKGKGINDLAANDIDELIGMYEKAAIRAKKAGFDGIEVHGAHGYLVCQFLSPLTNSRNDEYGGSISRRAAFAVKVVRRIKECLGEAYPVSIRLSATEKIPGGLTIHQTSAIASILGKGGVDVIHVSAGTTAHSLHWVIQPMCFPRGCLTSFAAEIKKNVGVPVIAVGRINNPALADQIIANGDADFVAMGRPLLADPWLPKKAKEGRTQEIRMCTGCNYCAGERFMNYRQVRCAVNAEAGRESAYELKPALRKKRVLIVGAGPAGMEAARILSARGHEVFLYEKEEYLGGNLRYAYLAPHKEEWKCFLDYLTSQMARLGDHVRLGKIVGEEDLQEVKPDAVVIATGTDAIIPNIKGIGSADVVLATDILSMKREAGSTVVVIGGGSVGCEVAEFLVQRGRKVTIVEACKDLARSVEPSTRSLLLERLANDGVIMLNECMVKAIEGDKLFLSSRSGQGKEVNADTIVVAVGYAPNRSILEGLYMKATEVFRVGDCKKSGSVADAIHNASWIARQI